MIGEVSDELELLYSCISVGASSRASLTVNFRNISDGLNPSRSLHVRRSVLPLMLLLLWSSLSVGGALLMLLLLLKPPLPPANDDR